MRWYWQQWPLLLAHVQWADFSVGSGIPQKHASCWKFAMWWARCLFLEPGGMSVVRFPFYVIYWLSIIPVSLAVDRLIDRFKCILIATANSRNPNVCWNMQFLKVLLHGGEPAGLALWWAWSGFPSVLVCKCLLSDCEYSSCSIAVKIRPFQV